MYNKHLNLTRPATLLALLFILSGTSVYSRDHDSQLINDTDQPTRYLLVQSNGDRIDNLIPPAVTPAPEPVTRPATSEKKCMVVCARWGEECTYTDRGIGGTSRECRRTCQQFTEECF